MRIHTARVSQIAAEMVSSLTRDKAVETDAPAEMRLDIEAVLNQYIRDEHEVGEKAKDMLAARNLPQTDLGKIRRLIADQRKLKLGEEAIDYLLDQLIEMLMHSQNVAEVFAEDYELRRRMREPLRRQLGDEEELHKEVRAQLKHVEEGSALWEVEYRRMMEDMKRRKGL
ncbi:MAG: DUF507 family protein [Myxococcales bacterium]|nr:DUF507 family protein [Myxococcales bacterium]